MEFAALDETSFNRRVNDAAMLLKNLLHPDERRALLLNIMEIIDADKNVRFVLKELPMEFAVEAQKLVAISLEGSVG